MSLDCASVDQLGSVCISAPVTVATGIQWLPGTESRRRVFPKENMGFVTREKRARILS